VADDEGKIEFSPEEVVEIVEWALSVAPTIVMMKHHPRTPNELKNLRAGINEFVNEFPEVLFDIAHDVAVNTLQEVQKHEAIVEDFVEELKEL
jgi:TRAP-type mannitol/chloroaromatic compound transport system substrate-binding protein